jgi:hypothetical protein
MKKNPKYDTRQNESAPHDSKDGEGQGSEGTRPDTTKPASGDAK